MEIQSITHKSLRRFGETGNPLGLDAQLIGRLGKMLVFLASAGSVEQLKAQPNYGVHELTGDRAGT